MTNEEVERAIDFLLKGQARFDARLEAYMEQSRERQDRTDEQIAQTNAQLSQLSDRVDALADTQTEFMRVMTKFTESQTRSNDSTAARQANIEVALVRLADAQAQSERRLESLTKIVEEERGR
jgi:chromosome segregation ATPase